MKELEKAEAAYRLKKDAGKSFREAVENRFYVFHRHPGEAYIKRWKNSGVVFEVSDRSKKIIAKSGEKPWAFEQLLDELHRVQRQVIDESLGLRKKR